MTSQQVMNPPDKDMVWPKQQVLMPLDEPTIVLSHFPDIGEVSNALAAFILELERGSPFADGRFPGGCGFKVRHVGQWGDATATLLEARALELFRRVTGSSTAVVIDSWASIYRNGEYCMPHSHTRAAGSVVCLVDPGEEAKDDPLAGKLAFADPRMKSCCQVAEGYMTNLLVPAMQTGSMIIFPAAAVHAVAPYRGQRPRITMSWNIAQQELPAKRLK